MSFKAIFEPAIYDSYGYIVHALANLETIDACFKTLCPKSASKKLYTNRYEMIKYQLANAQLTLEDYILQ